MTQDMTQKMTMIKKILMMVLMVAFGITVSWGQTHPYAGVWCLTVQKNTSYYMVPAKDPQITTANHVYEDAYFSSDYTKQAGDSEKPFITTYQTSGDLNSIWIFVPVSGEDNYYYIVHALTGKYVKYQTYLTGNNARRKFVHLETIADPGETEKFQITELNAGVKIKPKNNVMFFNVAGDNQARYNGGTSSLYYSGMVGGMSGTDDNSQFNLIDASSAITLKPEISDVDEATNTFTITSPAAAFSTIRYTTDGSTAPDASTGTETTSGSPIGITDSWTVQAVGVFGSFVTPKAGPKNLAPIRCAAPVISYDYSTKMVSITCTTAGATIHYTIDGSPATSSSTPYAGPFAIGSATTIRAIAVKAGDISNETIFLPPTEVSSSSDIQDMNGSYILASNFSSTGSVGTSDNPFKGTIDGNLIPLTLSYPLVAYADGAIIKNVIVSNVSISIGTNVGAICGEATGDTRIYNCGVLNGSVGGSNNVGGIVGILDGKSRVINCYNYANIISGSNCGGIVGYNNVASTSSNLQTMVMSCMFYGNIAGGNAAPIYGGEIIHNKYASADDTGLNNYCYFLYDEEKNPYVKTIATDNYHGALGAEERYLNRFEFFRMTLNSTRNLAAYYVTGDATKKGEMAKWVLDKSIAPYPILKAQDKYPSVVNPDASHATTQTERNKGGKLGTLSVSISGTGSGAVFSAPTGASITTDSKDLNITDKDFDNFNFNYRKVQLPYYNEVGTGNYTKASDGTGRVVTGWKIVKINDSTEGTGSFTTDTYDYPSFNFVDRKCTNKDLYSVSGRVFAQGAYWEVPDGVTAITIEPYWAKAVYLSDANYDMTYTITISGTGSNATATANKYGVTVCGSCPTNYNGQTVYTDLSTAITDLGSNASHKVYDYAVVLVGNYHQAADGALVNNEKPVTFMSADLDGDNEPDNTLFYYHNQRKVVSPIRFDFLNIPGIGMVKRTHDATMDPEPGIFAPKGWFEITNTVFIRFGQFEYAGSNSATKTILAPLILQGGIYEQFVSCTRTNARNTNYLLVGGNAWFKNFANGCHTAQANTTPKVPVNVTGGDYTNFYLTGIYQPNSNEALENAECYIDGGRFTEVAGAGMQQIKGDVTWLINAADITSFYGGGVNAAKPITGSITTTISNSHVDEFYGGPKFGDMSKTETVTTDATDCHFGKFFGAGYGGTAFNKVLPSNAYDHSDVADTRDWNTWVTSQYKRAYSSGNGGISTNYDYEFILHSDGNQTVARFYVNYASLSLASTRNVTSTLSGCTIGTFYGGGRLGAVNGDVNSTLTNCTVTGNAFGAGFSASVPTVEVWNANAYLTPNPTYNRTANVFNNASVKTPKYNNEYVEYTWSKTYGSNASPFVDTEDGKHYIHTEVSLDGLGAVTGKAKLTINGGKVEGSVFGGGDMSKSSGDTEVNIQDGTIVNNVFGGGNVAEVGGSVTVNVTGGTIKHDVYGGGALANTNTNNTTTTSANTTAVNLTGGTILGDAYGGGLGQIGRAANPDLNAEAIEDIPAMVKGDVTVTLNGSKLHNTKGKDDQNNDISVSGRIFGCNNLNGWPLGSVTVQVEKTVPYSGNEHQQGTYEVAAVYGGGNLAMYKPTDLTKGTTNVIINGCDNTSIEQVYGGGNAASTPATQVTINGTYEINEVFGGGNGKDRILKNGQRMDNPGANVGYYEYADNATDAQTPSDRETHYQYGSGEAHVNINGGRIHSVYGGSNTKGNVRKTAVAMLEELKESDGTAMCSLNVDEAYGGGKSAPMDGEAKLEMKCIPGLKAAYGGAENADIRNNVTLNITNGTFEQVFGGNNLGGRIDGSITVNVEETGCRPVIIGELYGGGNRAAYSVYGYKQVTEGEGENAVTTWQPRVSNNDDGDQPNNDKYADPTVNIRSFSSIGSIYGGGYGSSAVMVGDPHVDINVVEGQPDTYPASGTTFGSLGTFSSTGYSGVTKEIDGDIVTIPPHKPGELGVINNVFGGGNQAMVIGDTYVNIGTSEKINFQTKTKSQDSPQQNVTVKGANIVGNVYGGGNAADVTGKTNVTIGRKKEE